MADYEDQTDYADDADVLGDTAVSRDDEGGARPEGLSKQPSINAGSGAGEYSDEAELEEIKKHVREMEEETEKLKEMQSEVEKQLNSSGSAKVGGNTLTIEEKQEVDARSIFVGGVDFGATAEELEAHFHGCGAINRVTILTDRYSGHPKGYAYIEFADKDSVTAAMALDETLFRARQLKVMPKRTNLPGVNAPRGGGRGGGFRGGFRGGWGGGGFRGGYGGYGAPYPPAFPPYGGPRGAYRGAGRSRRPRAWYAPY